MTDRELMQQGDNIFIGGVIFVFLFCVFVSVLGVSDRNGQTEREFREACSKVNGTAVWNKKYWECLK